MKKKKGLIITGCIVAGILLLMAVIPLFMGGKVQEIIKREGNKMLNAKFDFEALDISLFRDFPRASVALDNFYMVGVGDFTQDTLVRAGRAAVSVDVLSLFSDNFRIGRIALEDATLHAIVLPDGRANWDIMKPDTTATEETEEQPADSGSIGLQLKKLSVENLNVIYDDYQSGLHASVKGFTADCSGDFGADLTDVQLSAAIQALSLRMGLIPYIADAELETNIDLTADLKNRKFTLNDNRIRLNAIETSLDGWLAMPDSTRIDMDLKLNTNDIGFKELLSLIPAIYQKEFAELKTSGTASLTAQAKGSLVGDSILPAFSVALNVKDASFRYPSLPAGVDRIQIGARVSNPGGSADGTVVEIAPFSLQMAGIPFSLNATVKTPVSDPDFQMQANGSLNLANIQKVYPLGSDTKLTGVLTADVQMQGRLSYVEREQYDKFQAKGTLDLKDLLLHTSGMDEVKVNRALLTFTPQALRLSQTELLIGQNDLGIEGSLSNYLGYVLKDQTLKGSLALTSNYLNLNDFMGSTTADAAAASEKDAAQSEKSAGTSAENTQGNEEKAAGVIEVPRNVDFQLTTDLKKILFDNMTFEAVQGKAVMKNGTVDMQGLSLNTMGGNVKINGSYSTAHNVQKPEMGGAFQLTGLSFAQAYKELNVIRSLAPIFENLQGNFSGSMNLQMTLDETLSPITETMNGSGSLSTHDVNLSNIAILKKVATACKKTDLLAQNVKDLNIHFNLVNGKLITEPFTVKLGQYGLKLEGSTALDKSIDYTGTIELPGSDNALLSSIGLKIGGTFSSPKISIDTKSMAQDALNSAAKGALNAVGEKLGVDLSSAEKQKEALVNEAKKAGEKLVSAAQKQADDLAAKAKDKPLQQLAAKKSGEALVKAAQKQADKLLQEAEKQGDALIEKAKAAQ